MKPTRQTFGSLAPLANLALACILASAGAAAQTAAGSNNQTPLSGDVFSADRRAKPACPGHDPRQGTCQVMPAMGQGTCVPPDPSWFTIKREGNTCTYWAPNRTKPLQGQATQSGPPAQSLPGQTSQTGAPVVPMQLPSRIIVPIQQTPQYERNGSTCGYNPQNPGTAVCTTPVNQPAEAPSAVPPGSTYRYNPDSKTFEIGDNGNGLNTGIGTSAGRQQYQAPLGQVHGHGSVQWRDAYGPQQENVTVDIWSTTPTYPQQTTVAMKTAGRVQILIGTLNRNRLSFLPQYVQCVDGQTYPVLGAKPIALGALAR